jgi:hypothetical protein
MRLAIAALAAVAAVAVVVATVRFVDNDQPTTVDPGAGHIHALGLNPADRSLYIATHTGLFRVDAESDGAERVGDRRQDTMGFTVAGRDHFLGSGHPDLRDELPPLLGLIESRDAGKTWTPISLLGQVDFHALRVRGSRIVGYDATSGRVMISDDRGQSWRSSEPPEPLIDLVLDPTSAERILAAGESRLFLSPDAGRTWAEREQGTGLLAWPRPDRLYLLDGGGRLWLSPDGGRRWNGRATIGGRPAALLGAGPDTLYAANHQGEVKRSSDGGKTWTNRGRP